VEYDEVDDSRGRIPYYGMTTLSLSYFDGKVKSHALTVLGTTKSE
jgi:hypothetical protein